GRKRIFWGEYTTFEGMLVPQEAAVDVDDVVVASVHVDDAANIVTDVVAYADAEPT
nr:hypothetical protein [Tanacetum cinerariifolium]